MNMLIIGLTGNLGAGKTTVAGMFKKLGAKVLNADEMAHELISPHGTCFKEVVRSFGEEILTNGKIDRKKLARIVFSDSQKLARLNKIIHPKVIQQISGEIRKFVSLRAQRSGAKQSFNAERIASSSLKNAPSRNDTILIVEAALLIESGLHKLMDEIIVVTANQRLQLKRISKQRGIPKEEALKRLRMQMGVREKMKYADVVIDNRGNLNQTKKQVEEICQRIMQRNRTK